MPYKRYAVQLVLQVVLHPIRGKVAPRASLPGVLGLSPKCWFYESQSGDKGNIRQQFSEAGSRQ